MKTGARSDEKIVPEMTDDDDDWMSSITENSPTLADAVSRNTAAASNSSGISRPVPVNKPAVVTTAPSTAATTSDLVHQLQSTLHQVSSALQHQQVQSTAAMAMNPYAHFPPQYPNTSPMFTPQSMFPPPPMFPSPLSMFPSPPPMFSTPYPMIHPMYHSPMFSPNSMGMFAHGHHPHPHSVVASPFPVPSPVPVSTAPAPPVPVTSQPQSTPMDSLKTDVKLDTDTEKM